VPEKLPIDEWEKKAAQLWASQKALLDNSGEQDDF